MFPATIAQFLSKGSWLSNIVTMLSPGSWVYAGLFVVLILFFTYFWTATQFHPEQIASNVKKMEPLFQVSARKTDSRVLESTMNRITLAARIFSAYYRFAPLVGKILSVNASISHFLEEPLLILVGYP